MGGIHQLHAVAVLLIFSVSVLGLLSNGRCDAFLVGPKSMVRHRFPAALASSAGSYLDSLSTGAGSHLASSVGAILPGGPSIAAVSNTEFAYVPVLGLSHADAIADKAIACCKRNEFNPVTVFVLDASGSPLVSKRMDGCSPVVVPDFAKAKAYSCIVNKYPSRVFRDRYTSDESSAKFCQMTTMVNVSGGQMAPFPGGIILKLGETIVGAVGVSGAAGDEDEYCAIRGVIEAAVGLTTVPGHHSCSTIKDQL